MTRLAVIHADNAPADWRFPPDRTYFAAEDFSADPDDLAFGLGLEIADYFRRTERHFPDADSVLAIEAAEQPDGAEAQTSLHLVLLPRAIQDQLDSVVLTEAQARQVEQARLVLGSLQAIADDPGEEFSVPLGPDLIHQVARLDWQAVSGWALQDTPEADLLATAAPSRSPEP